VLYDSAVILEYLDYLAGGGKLFPHGEATFAVLRDQTLADGIMDAAILRVYEKRFKEPQYRDPAWDTYQAAKMARGLAHFEVNTPPPPASADDIDRRHADTCLRARLPRPALCNGEWRASHPNWPPGWMPSKPPCPPMPTPKSPRLRFRTTIRRPCADARSRVPARLFSFSVLLVAALQCVEHTATFSKQDAGNCT
jgi:glutathione S-transferase